MWTQDFDLHSHSTHSDGIHEVEEVAQKMKDSNVKYWALTDHDTISGWDEARESAKNRGIHFIPGVEITCSPGLDADEEELTLDCDSTNISVSAGFFRMINVI